MFLQNLHIYILMESLKNRLSQFHLYGDIVFDAKIVNQDEKMLFVHKSIRVKNATFESPIKAITGKNLFALK